MNQTSAHKSQPGSFSVDQQSEELTYMFSLKLRSSGWTLRTLTCMVSEDRGKHLSNGKSRPRYSAGRANGLCTIAANTSLPVDHKTKHSFLNYSAYLLWVCLCLWEKGWSGPYCPHSRTCPSQAVWNITSENNRERVQKEHCTQLLKLFDLWFVQTDLFRFQDSNKSNGQITHMLGMCEFAIFPDGKVLVILLNKADIYHSHSPRRQKLLSGKGCHESLSETLTSPFMKFRPLVPLPEGMVIILSYLQIGGLYIILKVIMHVVLFTQQVSSRIFLSRTLLRTSLAMFKGHIHCAWIIWRHISCR